MWIVLHMMKRAVSLRPLAWTVRIIVLTVFATVALSAWWVGTSIFHDQQRQASLLSIDIILVPEVDVDAGSSAADECAEALKRRPDVASVMPLGKRAVWQLFQYELGLQAGGLTDVAAMPSVMQVRLKPDYAGLKHAKIVRDYALRNHRDIIDRVLIPEQAFADSDHLLDDAKTLRYGIAGLALALFLIVLSVVARSTWGQMIAPSVNVLLGQRPYWGMSGVLILVGCASVLACTLAYAALALASPQLQSIYPWLGKISTMM